MKNMPRILLTLLLCLSALRHASAATLNAGDIVVIGHNSETTVETISFMPLVNIPAGTVVKMSDHNWTDPTATPPNAFGTNTANECKLTWTPAAMVPAGTLFLISRGLGAQSITFLNITTGVSITANTGSTTGELFYSGWTTTGNVLNVGGDGVFFYQDADSSPFFLSGFLNSSTTANLDLTSGWHAVSGPSFTTGSALPVAAVGNQNGVNIGTAPYNDGEAGTYGLSLWRFMNPTYFANVQYTGPTSGTNRAGWLSRVMTATNWSGASGTTVPANTLGTTLGSSASFATQTTVTSLNRVNPATTNLSTVNWTLTFAAANTGVSASNFSLSGAAAAGATVGTPTIASGGGLTWNVPVTTGSTDGELTLSLANATGTTPGVSTSLPFAGQNYTMDKTRPTVSIGAPSASSVAPGGSVSYTVTYADANFASSSLTTGGISLNTTGGASGTIGLTGSGTSYTVTISNVTGAGTIGINVAASTSLDTAGNANLVSAASTTFTVLTPPTITTGAATSITVGSAVLNGSGNGNGSVTTLTYEWGLTTSYGNTVSMGTATGAFAALGHTISGLTPGTEYHFRLVGASVAGTTNGADQSFITLSNNADLSAFTTTATGMTPGFGAATTAYNATVTNGTTTTTVTATRAQANATLEVRVNGGSYSALTSGVASGALALNVGANPIDVRVTAQDGTTIKTYTITVTRAAPAADIPMTLTSGSLTIDATGSSNPADTVLRYVTGPGGPFLEFFDSTRTLGAPAGGTQVDANTVRIPLSSITGGLVINGSPLADKFTFDFNNGDILPPGGLTVNGGLPTTSPGDAIAVEGSFTDISYDANNVGAGTLDVAGFGSIAFTGIEPLDFSGATISGTLTIDVDPGNTFAGNVITTIAAVDAGVNTDVTFGTSGLESIKFGSVTGAVVINGDNAEQDYFLLTGVGSAMVGAFTIDGKGGDSDVIEIPPTATVTLNGVDKSTVLRADFIGVGRDTTTPTIVGTLNFKGSLTMESDGTFLNAAPTPLWGTSGTPTPNVWGTAIPSYFPNLSFNMSQRGCIVMRGDLNKTGGADATVLLKAKAGICLAGSSLSAANSGGKIVSTSNKANIILNADSDADNVGMVQIGGSGALTSNGGDITIGGGANPLTTPARGFVSGTTFSTGFAMQSSTITSGGGNISIRGEGAATTAPSSSTGITFASSSALASTISSGAGTITLVGTGGNGNSGSHGISFQSASTAINISATTGNITITGTGFANAANANHGISMTGTATAPVSITSGGNVSVTGTGQTGTNNHGLTMTSGITINATGSGTVAVTGSTTGAGSAVGLNIAPATGATSGFTTAGGNITVTADTMILNGNSGTETITTGSSTAGTVTLKPLTAGKNIALGSGVTDSATQLGIDSGTELTNVTAGTIAIGEAASGTLTVSSVISPVNFKTLALASGSGTTFSATSGFTADVTSASVFEKVTVTGTVSITAGATLSMNSTGGYIWNGTDSFTLLDNDLADAITGTFTGPTLTNFLGSTLTATQSYTGGTGNDLVFAAPLSSNADLSALVINTATLSPTFAAGTTTGYTASVSNATSSVTVTPTRAQANATIEARSNANAFASVTSGSPSGALALNLGSNTLDVKVTAQDGITIKTYTLTVTRRSIIEDWRLGFFADASGTLTRANGADFDLDGKTNLLEFAFGTDPTLGSSGPPALTMTGTYAAAVFGTTGQPITKLESITNGVDFRAVFIRRVDHAAAGLTYTPEFSADNFTSFTPSAILPTVLATSGDFQLVSVPYPHFLPNGKKARFFRVSVSIAP